MFEILLSFLAISMLVTIASGYHDAKARDANNTRKKAARGKVGRMKVNGKKSAGTIAAPNTKTRRPKKKKPAKMCPEMRAAQDRLISEYFSKRDGNKKDQDTWGNIPL